MLPDLHEGDSEFDAQAEYDGDDDDSLFHCPECGAEVHEDTQKCPQCGDWITPVEPGGGRRKILYLVVILLLVAALLVLTVF